MPLKRILRLQKNTINDWKISTRKGIGVGVSEGTLKHTVVIQPNCAAWGGGNIRMQLTFFIGQKIKCPGQSIYLNHASVFTACLSKSSPWCCSSRPWWKRRTEETIPDSNPRAWALGPVWGVDGESDAANSCWGSIFKSEIFPSSTTG